MGGGGISKQKEDWSEKTHTTNTPINRIKGREQHGETRANSPNRAVEGWPETTAMMNGDVNIIGGWIASDCRVKNGRKLDKNMTN